MDNAQKTIASIEEKYPKKNQEFIQNCSDLNLAVHMTRFNQFIIGCTKKDRFTGGIDHYNHMMKNTLKNVSTDIVCWACPFYDYELQEAKVALAEFSAFYEVELDIETMIKGLNIHQENGETYYIVITIVPVNILSA